MSTSLPPEFDPTLDLALERVIAVKPELVWRAWTRPQDLMPWFCPKPWRTTECEIDLRPGGKFRTAMEGPAGERHDNTGCYLEIVPNRRLVWTSELGPGFRPAGDDFLAMTAFILLAPEGAGTRYCAVVLHKDAASRQKHADMGFEGGWGTALDQLVAWAKTQ